MEWYRFDACSRGECAKEGSKTEFFSVWRATDINFPIKTPALGDKRSVKFTNPEKGVPFSRHS